MMSNISFQSFRTDTSANSADPDETAPRGAVSSGSALFAICLNTLMHDLFRIKRQQKLLGMSKSLCSLPLASWSDSKQVIDEQKVARVMKFWLSKYMYDLGTKEIWIKALIKPGKLFFFIVQQRFR